MKLLDLDMDYFMEKIATFISENRKQRLSEEDYGGSVWVEERVRKFLESNTWIVKG